MLDFFWKLNTERRQPRRFWECVEGNFLTQLVSEPTGVGPHLDLLFTSREGLVGDVLVGGCVGHSDHEMREFTVLGEVRKMVSKTSTLDFPRVVIGLFRTLNRESLGKQTLTTKRSRNGGNTFKRKS